MLSETAARAELAVAQLVLKIAKQENSHEYIVAFLEAAVNKAQNEVDAYTKPWLSFLGKKIVREYSQPFNV